jgi:hypothetical protein
MGEEVLAAAIGLDEAETLGFVEPFDDAGLSGHVKLFLGDG